MHHHRKDRVAPSPTADVHPQTWRLAGAGAVIADARRRTGLPALPPHEVRRMAAAMLADLPLTCALLGIETRDPGPTA